MKHNLFWLLIFVIPRVFSMEPTKETDLIVKEIEEAKKSKHEKLAALINHKPFPQSVPTETYQLLKRICKPEYSKLLIRLLPGIVSPNLSYEIPTILGVYKAGLLADAIEYGIKKDNFMVIEILLRFKTQQLNQEICTFEEVYTNSPDQISKFYSTTPLLRSVKYKKSTELLHLLLKGGADPNLRSKTGKSPLMELIKFFGHSEVQEKLQRYQNIKMLLDYGALIDLAAKEHFDKISTPITYAYSIRAQDLIMLFQQYPNNIVAKSSKRP